MCEKGLCSVFRRIDEANSAFDVVDTVSDLDSGTCLSIAEVGPASQTRPLSPASWFYCVQALSGRLLIAAAVRTDIQGAQPAFGIFVGVPNIGAIRENPDAGLQREALCVFHPWMQIACHVFAAAGIAVARRSAAPVDA